MLLTNSTVRVCVSVNVFSRSRRNHTPQTLGERDKDKVLAVLGARLADISRVLNITFPDNATQVLDGLLPVFSPYSVYACDCVDSAGHLDVFIQEDAEALTAVLNGSHHPPSIPPNVSSLAVRSVFEALALNHERYPSMLNSHVPRRTSADLERVPDSSSVSHGQWSSGRVDDDDAVDSEVEVNVAVEARGAQFGSPVTRWEKSVESAAEDPSLTYNYNEPISHGPCNIPRRGVDEHVFQTVLEFLMLHNLLAESMENLIAFHRPVHVHTYRQVVATLDPLMAAEDDHSYTARHASCTHGMPDLAL